MSIAERVAALNANHLDQSRNLKNNPPSSQSPSGGVRSDVYKTIESRSASNPVSGKPPPPVLSKRTTIQPPTLPPRQSSNSQCSSIPEVDSAMSKFNIRAEPAQVPVSARRQSANTAVIGLSGVVQFNGISRSPGQSVPNANPTSSGNVQRAPPTTPTPRPDVARPPLLPARSSPLQITATKPPCLLYTSPSPRD